jgi:hypothetical protein
MFQCPAPAGQPHFPNKPGGDKQVNWKKNFLSKRSMENEDLKVKLWGKVNILPPF